MRIILSLSSYLNLTGSEIYTYELARELSSRGTHVTILANQIGGEILQKTKKYRNITVLPFFDHGEDLPADLVISSQPSPTNYCLRFFPNAVHMQILHSLFPYEEPVISKQIKQYIAVRPEIKEYWQKEHPLFLKDNVSVIWNGVDTKRFNEDYEKQNHKIPVRLFVGTVDHLRKMVIQDLVQDAIKDKHRLWLVLPQNPFPQDIKLPDNITLFEPKWDIEKYVKQCDETAGIFIGRTTIEGFMMGKKGLVYDVDMQGNILKKATYGIPENRNIFDIKVMTDKIIETYTNVRYD